MLRAVSAIGTSVLMLAAVAACGGDEEPKTVDSPSVGGSNGTPGEPSAGESAGSTPSVSATPFDPPKKFDAASNPVGPPSPGPPSFAGSVSVINRVALVKTTAVMPTKTGFEGTDLTTGTALWQTPVVPQDQLSTIVVGGTSEPVTMTVGGKTLVVAAFGERVKGTGTVKDHGQLSVQAVDPADGKLAWKLDIDWTPFGRDATDSPNGVGLLLADEEQGLIAMGVGDTTIVVDANTQKMLWGAKQTELVALGKGVVAARPRVAKPTHGLIAVDARTKQPRWSAIPWAKGTTNISAVGAGPSQVVIMTEMYSVDPGTGASKESKVYRVVALSNGKDSSTFKATEQDRIKMPVVGGCAYDGTSVLACSVDGEEMFGIDDASGRKLWWFDSAGGRIPPILNDAFHGVLYAKAQNGPALLDAKTGQDIAGDPGVVAMTVNEYGAASYESDIAQVQLHRATG